MSNDPSLNAKQVIKVLLSNGFVYKRTRGSHATYFKEGCGVIPVPIHGAKDIPKGTLKNIIDRSGISRDVFFN